MFPFIYKVSESNLEEEIMYTEDGIRLYDGNEYDMFIQEYGAYMEMIYILSNGDLMKMDIIFEMNAIDFLFRCEYLMRKKELENKEQLKQIKNGGS